MPQVGNAIVKHCAMLLTAMERERDPWRTLWRDLADFYLPNRYQWLLTEKERNAKRARNEYILDNTGTMAARVLAAGMMNAVTSPSRPWFKLRVSNFEDEQNKPVRLYLDEVERRMYTVFAGSNFYNSLQTVHLDRAVFGISAQLMYDDPDTVIRCFNPCLGEYCVGTSNRLAPDIFSREFAMTARQIEAEFPNREDWSDPVKRANDRSSGSSYSPFQQFTICHLIEPNTPPSPLIPQYFRYREYYWEKAANGGERMLRVSGFYEMPGVFPRWEAAPSDAYGVSPAMDALGDVIQLQHETKKKGQALDKMVSPPIVAPIELENRPTALMPNGITYVSGFNNVKAEAIYTVQPPIAEMTNDLIQIQQRIRETFHNPLFTMFSQLDTVRSATEIDARREEKLVLLGGVLERFQVEGLDPVIKRVFGIMQRGGLLPEPPPELEGVEIEVQYVSILSVAQRAVGTVPIERLLTLVGNLAAVYPEVLDVPNPNELIRDYAIKTGVPALGINSPEEVAAKAAKRQEETASAQALAAGDTLAKSAANLSNADVGGGANALQRLLGG